MANLSNRWPDTQTLEQGYYVVNGGTMGLISGPHPNTEVAYAAWLAARKGSPKVNFIIMWTPYENFQLGERKDKPGDVEKRAAKTIRIMEVGDVLGKVTHRKVKIEEPAPGTVPKTVEELIADIHAEHGPGIPRSQLTP